MWAATEHKTELVGGSRSCWPALGVSNSSCCAPGALGRHSSSQVGGRGRAHLLWHTQAWACGHFYCSPFQPSLWDCEKKPGSFSQSLWEKRKCWGAVWSPHLVQRCLRVVQAGFLPPVTSLVPKSVGLLCWGSAVFLSKEQSFSSKAQQ